MIQPTHLGNLLLSQQMIPQRKINLLARARLLAAGVELNRSFEDSVNATYSAENFFYNPALVNNFPTILQDSHVVWSEGV